MGHNRHNQAMLLLSRTIHFNSAHRLYRPDRSEEWNRRVYGKAANPGGFGHNYALELSVMGTPDPDSAMIVNLTDLDRILKDEVDRPLDHRHLNFEVPEFAQIPATAENLARWIWTKVEARIRREGWACRIAQLKLTVTPGFSVEITVPGLDPGE
jgi:6-pyruvoyltetrahydropterin/6-carboxytetrahydropterin synthase